MAQTSFNSEQFSWAETTVQIGGRVLTGVQGVSYKVGQQKDYLYGKGDKPLGIQRGNYTYEGSTKILQSELTILQDGAPEKDLMQYRGLTITVGYETKDGQELTLDNLVGVEFVDVEKAMEQGKGNMEVQLPIMFLSIQTDV